MSPTVWRLSIPPPMAEPTTIHRWTSRVPSAHSSSSACITIIESSGAPNMSGIDRRLINVLWMVPPLLLGTLLRATAATPSLTAAASPAAAPALIEVDAREAPRGIMSAHLRLPGVDLDQGG